MSNNILNLMDRAHNDIILTDMEIQSVEVEISSYYRIIESLANKKEILQRKRELIQKDFDNALKLWQDENKSE